MIGNRRGKAKGRRTGLSIRGEASRSGRAAGVVLLLTALAALALGALLILGRGGDRERVSASRPADPATVARGAPRPPSPTPPEREEASVAPDPGPAAEGELGVQLPGAEEGDRFEGEGVLRIHVEAEGAAEFPERWSLVLEPSRYLEGGDRAQRIQVDFEAGERDHKLEGVPFAGYDLRVEAEGWNSRIFPILLDRYRSNLFVNVAIQQAGFLEGVVVDATRLPATEIGVHLESMADGERREATTDEAGRFRFEGVRDGNYKLFVGPPENPLLPPSSLAFQAPSMFLPDFELPPLGTAEFTVTDFQGFAVADVLIRGAGSAGGMIEGRTGADGTLVVPHLVPGRYRVRTEVAGHQTRRASFDLEAGEREQVILRLK